MRFPADSEDPFYVGLAGINVEEGEVNLGMGVLLRPTFAHLMAPFLLAFAPARQGCAHPAPWKAATGGLGWDIHAEIEIPHISGASLDDRLTFVRTVLALIRLWACPSILAPVVSTIRFATAANAPDNAAHFLPFEVEPMHMRLKSASDCCLSHESLGWITTALPKTVVLVDRHPELDMAMVALDRSQFVREPALILMSLWAALEAIFSPDKAAELKFRVAARIASYLEPAGAGRLELYKKVRKLYDARSAAAHGSSKLKPEFSLIETYSVLRRAFILIIDRNHFPTQQELEALIFSPEDAHATTA
ncbi:MAG: hypothetical protein DME97_09545 [Verrucomicrobia bacterium]|nr:MAG: hypothetical protein DME97_09545 [Verrucomicrobiota bacterium]